MHYYERNIGDYYKKAGRLNILQHGVYTLLIDACYDREQFPTLEEAIDWVWAETDEEIEAVKFVLRKFFKPDGNGVYVQHHIEQDLIAYQEFLDKQTENGKKGGRPKKPTDSQELAKETQNNPLETQNNPIKPKQSLNQEPITNNQEPINIHTQHARENFDDFQPDLKTLNAKIHSAGGKPISQEKLEQTLVTFLPHYETHQLTQNQLMGKLVTWIMRDNQANQANNRKGGGSVSKIPDNNTTDWVTPELAAMLEAQSEHVN